MVESLTSLANSIQNNQLLVLMFSGGIIWTLIANIGNILSRIGDAILACISFTVNSVNVGDYDIPLLNYKITKVFSDTKVLWERHTELRPSTSDYSENRLQNSAYGRSYRWMWGHFIILDREYSTQSTKVVMTIRARVFFANRKRFIQRLIDEVERCSLSENRDTITVNMGKGISMMKPKRAIDSVYSNNGIARKVLNDIRSFMSNRELYIKGNSPYKFVSLLAGPPGTGKTSLIHAVASELGMGVRFINTDDEEFEDIARVMTHNDEYSGESGRSIIVIEDVDCMSMNATSKRDLTEEQKDLKDTCRIEDGDTEVLIDAKRRYARENGMDDVPMNPLSLSSILNLLDGIITPSGTIVFLTTNRPEKLDDALLRDGRIDARYDFENFTSETANNLVKDYLGFTIDNMKSNVVPASIQRDVMKVMIGQMSKETLINKYSA